MQIFFPPVKRSHTSLFWQCCHIAEYSSPSFQPNDAAADEAEFHDTLFNVRWMRALYIQFMQYIQSW